MITIVGIRLENIGPFVGQHHLQLEDRGLVLIEGRNLDDPGLESNGAGKSTMFDALTWGLFGEATPRKDGGSTKGLKGKDVITEGLKKGRVAIQFRDSDDGAEYTVYRSREGSKNVLRVWRHSVDGRVELSSSDMAPTQAKLDQILGVSHSVWSRGIVFGQSDSWEFCDATDAQRAAMLTEVFELEAIDSWLAEAKGLQKEEQSKLTRLEGELSVLERQPAPDPDRYREAAETWEQEQQTNIAGMEASLAAMGDPGTVDDDLGDPPEAPSSPEELAELRQKRATLLAQYNAAQSSIDDLRLKDPSSMLGQECGTCGVVVTKESHKTVIENWHEELEAIEDRQAGIVDEGVPVKARIEELEAELAEAQEAYKVEREAYRNRQWQLQQARGAVERQIAERSRLEAQLEQARKAENPHTGLVEDLQKRAQEHARGLALAQARVRVARMSVAEHEALVAALSPKGAKGYLFDHAVGKMMDATNDWLRDLTEGTMWVRFDTEKTTAGGAKREGFAVDVFRSCGSEVYARAYKKWSGGERRRVAIANDLGVATLIAERASRPFSLTVLDEAFRGLDAEGKERVVDALEKRMVDGQSRFVVDHDTRFKARFPSTVVVTRKDGRSQVSSGAGEDLELDEEEWPEWA